MWSVNVQSWKDRNPGSGYLGSRFQSLRRVRFLLRRGLYSRHADTRIHSPISIPCLGFGSMPKHLRAGDRRRSKEERRISRSPARVRNSGSLSRVGRRKFAPAAGGERDSRRSVSIAPAAGRDAGPTVPVRGGPHVLRRRSRPAEIARISGSRQGRAALRQGWW